MAAPLKELTWVEISREALMHNIRQLRERVCMGVILCPCVKANAYGHGLVGSARAFLEAGADWLSVNSLGEARELREAGIEAPVYVLGYIALDSLEEAVMLGVRIVVYNRETALALGTIGRPVRVHLKAETGNNRQGLGLPEILELARSIREYPHIEIEGLATHFANIEDTTDHSYARAQIRRFEEISAALREAGVQIPLRHSANSAAVMLFPETHFEMVRPGIASYGMWPSAETHVTGVKLVPSFTWKTRIAQVKKVPAGEYIGYGCTFQTTRETRLAILPVGYYDGYDRGVHDAHVLIHGKRAPLRGRVCMNIIMADVTDIPEARLEDEVVLIGGSGNDTIPAEQFADWADTINYEVTTRVNDRIVRVFN